MSSRTPCGYAYPRLETADLDKRFADGGKAVNHTHRPRFSPKEEELEARWNFRNQRSTHISRPPRLSRSEGHPDQRDFLVFKDSDIPQFHFLHLEVVEFKC